MQFYNGQFFYCNNVPRIYLFFEATKNLSNWFILDLDAFHKYIVADTIYILSQKLGMHFLW